MDWIQKTGLTQLVWATDLDLTLVVPSVDPNKAAAPAGLEEACQRLDSKTQGAFFIITGRDIAYVDNKLFPNARFRISAEYHNMTRFDPGVPPLHLNPIPQWNLIDNDLDALSLVRAELCLRKKIFMRSLHYTNVPDAERAVVKEQLREKLTDLLTQLSQLSGQAIALTDGGHIFDMGPANSDKGRALEDILRHVGQSRTPIYFGDSPGDLPAGRVAKVHGGIFVAVGKDPAVVAEADFVLDNPAACCNLMIQVSRWQPAPAP